MTQWIKVTDHMPELNDKGQSEIVLAVGPKKVILQNFTIHNEWQFPMKITHWMPLPELPKDLE